MQWLYMNWPHWCGCLWSKPWGTWFRKTWFCFWIERRFGLLEKITLWWNHSYISWLPGWAHRSIGLKNKLAWEVPCFFLINDFMRFLLISLLISRAPLMTKMDRHQGQFYLKKVFVFSKVEKISLRDENCWVVRDQWRTSWLNLFWHEMTTFIVKERQQLLLLNQGNVFWCRMWTMKATVDAPAGQCWDM